MGNSKIVLGNETLIDLTQDTVNVNNLLSGATAHAANGDPITGAVITHNVIDNLTSTSSNDALSAKQGKELKELVDQKLDSSDVVALSNSEIDAIYNA